MTLLPTTASGTERAEKPAPITDSRAPPTISQGVPNGYRCRWRNNLGVSCAGISNATCRTPFLSCAVTEAYDPSTDASIMHSLARRAARTCLSHMDLSGLHMLYPLCDGQPTHVSCLKGRILSGWLRLAVTVGVPFLLAFLLVLLPLTCLRCRDQRRMKRLDKQLGLAHNEIIECAPSSAPSSVLPEQPLALNHHCCACGAPRTRQVPRQAQSCDEVDSQGARREGRERSGSQASPG